MTYISTNMLVARLGKCKKTVLRALKLSGVKREKFQGVKGFRIEAREATKFVAKHWPELLNKWNQNA